jgi:hypothetical protein
MNPKVILIDFYNPKPKQTPSEVRNSEYTRETLSKYDLGELIQCRWSELNDLLKIHDPFFIIATNEYEAEQIKNIKSDAMVYVTDSVSSIFSRKAETEEKKRKQAKVFSEVERLVEKIRTSTDEENKAVRKFASMDYKQMYDMIKKALISDNEDLKKKAWDLLWGPQEKHSNFIWMRVQMMAEVWEHSKGESLEKLMLMSMERHIEFGNVRQLDNFTDLEGKKYYQYMFLDPYGQDMNYIRRLPFADKDQSKISYENLLESFGIPTNFLRIQVEANSMKEEWAKYLSKKEEENKR